MSEDFFAGKEEARGEPDFLFIKESWAVNEDLWKPSWLPPFGLRCNQKSFQTILSSTTLTQPAEKDSLSRSFPRNFRVGIGLPVLKNHY
jgi:hypothetical protein